LEEQDEKRQRNIFEYISQNSADCCPWFWDAQLNLIDIDLLDADEKSAGQGF